MGRTLSKDTIQRDCGLSFLPFPPLLAFLPVAALLFSAVAADAHVIKLRIERREVVLDGAAFGAAGPYEKLVGHVDIGLDPIAPVNDIVVDLKLAPRNARGEAE